MFKNGPKVKVLGTSRVQRLGSVHFVLLASFSSGVFKAPCVP